MSIVRLHGVLHDKFGGEFDFEVNSVKGAIRALSANFNSFSEVFSRYNFILEADGRKLTMTEVKMEVYRFDVLDIYPEISGDHGGGVFNEILGGLEIIAGGVFSAFGAFSIGVPLILAGAGTIANSILYGGMVSRTTGARDDQGKSNLIDGVKSVAREGACMPIILGRVKTAGVVVSGIKGVTGENL